MSDVVMHHCPACGGVLPPEVLERPVVCGYCDGWAMLVKDKPASVSPDRAQRRRLLRRDPSVVLTPKPLTPTQLLWRRCMRIAPYVIAVPTGCAMMLHLGVILDFQNIEAVPGFDRGGENLLTWLFFVGVMLMLSGQGLLFALLCLLAATVNVMMTRQWILSNPEYDAIWLLQSETGLFHVAYVMVPLLLAVGWAMSQSEDARAYHTRKLSVIPWGAWLLALGGGWLGWTAVHRATLTDHAEALSAELDRVEGELVRVAESLSSGAQPERSIYGRTLDPEPVYMGEHPEKSNVAFVERRALLEDAWRDVYGSYGGHDLYLDGPLSELLHSRHTGENSRPTDFTVYEKSVRADWWVLYWVPEGCMSASQWVDVALVRAADAVVYDRFTVPCESYKVSVGMAIVKKLAGRTESTFEP